MKQYVDSKKLFGILLSSVFFTLGTVSLAQSISVSDTASSSTGKLIESLQEIIPSLEMIDSSSSNPNSNLGAFTIQSGVKDENATLIVSGVMQIGANTIDSGNFIGGGSGNKAEIPATFSTIVGGVKNRVTSFISLIMGGQSNEITGSATGSFIGGGLANKITNSAFSVIMGGSGNSISDGKNNLILGMENNKIIGGSNNTIVGTETTILGGISDTFVWSDSAFSPAFSGTFYINSANGLGINTNNPNASFDSNGAIKIGSGTELCSSDNQGEIKAVNIIVNSEELTCICGCDSNERLNLTIENKCNTACGEVSCDTEITLNEGGLGNHTYQRPETLTAGITLIVDNGPSRTIGTPAHGKSLCTATFICTDAMDCSCSNSNRNKVDVSEACEIQCDEGYIQAGNLCVEKESTISYCPVGNPNPAPSQSTVVSVSTLLGTTVIAACDQGSEPAETSVCAGGNPIYVPLNTVLLAPSGSNIPNDRCNADLPTNYQFFTAPNIGDLRAKWNCGTELCQMFTTGAMLILSGEVAFGGEVGNTKAFEHISSLKYLWQTGTVCPPNTAPYETFFNDGDTLTISGENGNYYLCVELIDDVAGNLYFRSPEYFALDNTPPASASLLINGGASITSTRTVNLTLSAVGASEMCISNDGNCVSREQYATTKARSLSDNDGTKTVTVKFRDLAGNATSPISQTIILDTTAPTSAFIAINGGVSYTTSPVVNLSLTAVGATQMCISNTTTCGEANREPYATTKNSRNLTTDQGSKTVYVQFKDDAGNLSTKVSASIIYDSIPPVISSVTKNPTTTTSGTVNLTINATDNIQLAAIPYSFNEGATYQSSPSKTFDSNQPVYITVKDNAGNMASTSESISNINSNVPTASISYSTAQSTRTSGDIIATMLVSEALSATPIGWTKVGDLSYIKTYTANLSETVVFANTAGTPGSVAVAVANIDKTAPTCGTWSPSVDTAFTAGALFTLGGNTDAGGAGLVAVGSTCTPSASGSSCTIIISDKAGNTKICTSPKASCATNYTFNAGYCGADTRTYTCTAKPATAIWIGASSFQQTRDGANRVPAASRGYGTTATNCTFGCSGSLTRNAGNSSCDDCSAYTITSDCPINGTCSYCANGKKKLESCDTHYTSNGTSCIADTQQFECSGLPANAKWTGTTGFIQTRNGSEFYPLVSSPVYGETSTPSSCNYSCITNYIFSGGSCQPNGQSANCGGTIPDNAQANGANTFIQTRNGSSRMPASKNRGYNTAECGYSCKTNNHTENGGTTCISNTRSCTIANGVGTQTRNGSSRNTCTVVSCNSTYHQVGNTCISNTKICEPLPANASAGTQTRNTASSSRGACVITACNTTFHLEGNTCISNTRPCNKDGGTGTQTWNGSRGECVVSACPAGYHVEGGNCVANNCNANNNFSVGGNQYNVPAVNHNSYTDQTITLTNTPSHGTTTCTTRFSCSLGAFTPGTPNCTFTCGAGYEKSGNSCVEKGCGATTEGSYSVPALAHNGSTTANIGPIVGTPLNGYKNCSRTFSCNLGTLSIGSETCTNYCNVNYNLVGSTCEAATQSISCPAGSVGNASRNNGSSYIQTRNGTTWLPVINSSTFSSGSTNGACTRKCASNYSYNSSSNSCVPTSNIASCPAIPSSFVANGATSYQQTRDTTYNQYTPIYVAGYSTTAGTCRYSCGSLTYNGSNCVDCSAYTLLTCPSLATCSSCVNGFYKITSCPTGYTSNGTSCVPNGCPDQVVPIQEFGTTYSYVVPTYSHGGGGSRSDTKNGTPANASTTCTRDFSCNLGVLSSSNPVCIMTCNGGYNIPGGGSSATYNGTQTCEPKVNATCGTVGNSYTMPTTNLCANGATPIVSGTGPRSRTCPGTNGGNPISCSVEKKIDGQCGGSNGAGFSSKPTTNLCANGATPTVSGTGPRSRTCPGTNGGNNSPTCTATVSQDGVCGDTTPKETKPTTNLCSQGTASSVSESLPWTWTCTGIGGGSPATCVMQKKINGSCGTSNGGNSSSQPSGTAACNPGNATNVSFTNGKFGWICAGENGGSSATCFSCATNYTPNGSTCEANTQQVSCGTAPAGGSRVSGYDKFTQTRNGSAWTPASVPAPSTNGASCRFQCNTNYTPNGSTCAANTQQVSCGTAPVNGSRVSGYDKFTQTWNGSSWTPASVPAPSINGASCRFQCNTNYTPNGSTCAANTQQVSCGTAPVNGSRVSGYDKFTQTWNGSSWTPASVPAPSINGASCRFQCNTNYTPNGSTCAANTQQVSCGTAPVNGSRVSGYDKFTQTWNGSSWTPASVPAPSTNGTSCRFQCNTNYTRNGTTCEANTRQTSCGTAPTGGAWVSGYDKFTQTRNGSAWTPASAPAASTNGATCRFQCNSGYTANGATCTANSCSALTNTGGYNVPALNHGYNSTQTRTGNGTVTNGSYTYSCAKTFTCNLGNRNTNSETCNYDYTCVTNYTRNGSQCVANSQGASCQGSIPANAESNATTTTRSATRNGVSRVPSYSRVHNTTPNICTYKCKTNYTRTESICNADTRVKPCEGLPANAERNTVSTIMQHRDGSSWIPTLAGAYSTTASASYCKFKCAQNYARIDNACVLMMCPAGNKTVNGHSYSFSTMSAGESTESTISLPGIPSNGTTICNTMFRCDVGGVVNNGDEQCNIVCNAGYHEDNGACVADIQTRPMNCAGTLPSNVDKGEAQFTQTSYNGGATWTPTSMTRTYSATMPLGPCTFSCIGGYQWNPTTKTCEIPTPTVLTRKCAEMGLASPENGVTWIEPQATQTSLDGGVTWTPTPITVINEGSGSPNGTNCVFKCIKGTRNSATNSCEDRGRTIATVQVTTIITCGNLDQQSNECLCIMLGGTRDGLNCIKNGQVVDPRTGQPIGNVGGEIGVADPGKGEVDPGKGVPVNPR